MPAATSSAATATNPSPLRPPVAIIENVRYEYAKVLYVSPVFQTVRVTRTEQHCEPVPTSTLTPVHVKGGETGKEKGAFDSFWDSVKNIFGHGDEHENEDVATTPAEAADNGGGKGPLLTPGCHIVAAGDEFRQPIAYDVDYIYKDVKYRSRLPEDPGSRLRVRVSVTPEPDTVTAHAPASANP